MRTPLNTIRDRLLLDIRRYIVDLDPIDSEALKDLVEYALLDARFDSCQVTPYNDDNYGGSYSDDDI